MTTISNFKNNSDDFAAIIAVKEPDVLSIRNDSGKTYDIAKPILESYGKDVSISSEQWNNELFKDYSERWAEIQVGTLDNDFESRSQLERSELIRNLDLKEDSEIIQKEVDKNKADSTETEKSEVSETIETVPNNFSQSSAQFNCTQSSPYTQNYNGSAANLGENAYQGEFPFSAVKAKTRGGQPSSWQPWINTLTYVVNPVIRAGYMHKGIVVNSSYRSNGSANHRYLGAIDFGYYGGDDKLEVLANFARGIIDLNTPFDKLLFESDERRYGENSGWIHVQVAKSLQNPERKVYSCRDGGCTVGNIVAGINIDYVRRGNVRGVD